MYPIRARWFRVGLFAFLAVLSLTLLAPDPAQAQLGGGMTRRGPSGGGGKKPTVPGGQGPKQETKWTDTGSDQCRIVDFEPAKESGDGEVLGIIRIRPLAKTAKTLKLQVRKSEEFTIKFDNSEATLDPEAFLALPLKNMVCDASWGEALPTEGEDTGDKGKKKSGGKTKQLITLTLKTVSVEGKIESIEGDLVTIKGKPAGGKQWPDVELKQKGQPEKKGNAKAPAIAQRKLKLKIIEDVSKFEDANNEAIEFGDFKQDQEVEAVVVCGAKVNLMVALRAPGVQAKKDKPEEQKPPGGGREGTRRDPPRQPPGGGGKRSGGI